MSETQDEAMMFLREVSRGDRDEFIRRLRDGIVDSDRERFFELYLNSASFKAMVTSLAEGMADVLTTMALIAEGEREVRDKMARALEARRDGVRL